MKIDVKKEEIVVSIRLASQFIDAVKRDIGKAIKLSDVRLGRLQFFRNEEANESGYLCFYAILDTPEAKEIYYLKAFHGKTPRTAKKGILQEKGRPGDIALCYRQEISPGSSFKAMAEDWYYVYNEVENDCMIIDKDTYTFRKLEKVRNQSQQAV